MTTICVLLLHRILHRILNKTPTTAKQLNKVNILIVCTSTERVQCVRRFVALRTPYNDTIHWRSGKNRILIVDENNRFQRK